MRSNAGGAKKRPTRYGATLTAPLALAVRLHKKGQREAAHDAYRAALEIDPGSVDALLNLAALEAQFGRAREARALFGHASTAAPLDARVARDVGIGLSSIGELAPARAALERALALDPKLVGARLHASRVCGELGDAGAARAHARAAVAMAPVDVSSQLELYRATFDDHALAPAIRAAERAVELEPGHALARYFLAAARAVNERSRALREHPAIPTALAAAANYALGQPGSATRFFATRQETLRFALANAALTGPVVELGVRFGVSTRVLAAGADQVDAFDSFEGLPDSWQGKPAGAFTTSGEAPDLPANVAVHVGWFEQTLPAYAAAAPRPLRLLHVDSDLYSSAATGLTALASHVREGTVIVFDEYIGNESWQADEHRAFEEAVARFGWRYQYLAFSWVTGQAVLRIEGH